MRVLGVDPGTSVAGYGLVAREGSRLHYLAAGTIRTNPRESKAARLKTLHDNLTALMVEYRPHAVSLERNFVAANVQSAFRIGEARAMVMLAAAQNCLPLFEYAPNEVKLTVTAYGHADKSQLQLMVRKHLEMSPAIELAEDAADALGLAICHLMMARVATLQTLPRRRMAR